MEAGALVERALKGGGPGPKEGVQTLYLGDRWQLTSLSQALQSKIVDDLVHAIIWDLLLSDQAFKIEACTN